MSKRQRTAMLHLARCASYLTKDHPLDAAVAHRRGDLVRAAFIGYRQRHEIESAKFTRSKKWRSVEQPRSPRFGALYALRSLCAEAGTRAAAPFPAPLSPLAASSFAALRTGFS